MKLSELGGVLKAMKKEEESNKTSSDRFPVEGCEGWIVVRSRGEILETEKTKFGWRHTCQANYKVKFGGKYKLSHYDKMIKPVFRWENTSGYCVVVGEALSRKEVEEKVLDLPRTFIDVVVDDGKRRSQAEADHGAITSRDCDGMWFK